MIAFLKSSELADEVAQRLALLVRLAAGRDEALHDGRRRRRGAGDLDLHRVVQEGVGEALDLRRHRRREEQRLAGERHELHDALDVRDEAHVEHPVRLVDDEELDAGKEELAALEMIEQPAGRGDEDVDAPIELGVLVAERHAADQQRHREAVIDAVLLEALLDLSRKLASGLENEGPRHARPRPPRLEHRQHRQGEGGRLARARLGDAEDVAAGEDVGDRLRLDRRRFGVAGGGDGLLDFVAQSEFGEGHRDVEPLGVCVQWGAAHDGNERARDWLRLNP